MPSTSTKSMVSKGEVSSTLMSHSSLVTMSVTSADSEARAAIVSMSFCVFSMRVETSTQDWAVASETYWFAWATMRLLVCCMKVDSVTTTAMNTRTKAAMESQYFFPLVFHSVLSRRGTGNYT